MARRPAHADVLAAALHDAHRLLARFARAQALADDPLRLALPALPQLGASLPTREVLGAWAALYLQAELEDAGVLQAVEALANKRQALALQDRATAAKLDRLAWTAPDYPSRDERAAVFARLFGMGPAAVRSLQAARSPLARWDADGGARLDFPQRLLRLATAVVRADLERQRGRSRPPLGPSSLAAWQAAAQDLLALAATVPAGSLVQWARRIHARSLQAFDLLGDAGLMRQLGARSAWDSLGHLLPQDGAPGRDAAARRGAAGQQLLRALADMPEAEQPEAQAVQAALRWLMASGLPVPAAPARLQPASSPRLPDTAFAAASRPQPAPAGCTGSWA